MDHQNEECWAHLPIVSPQLQQSGAYYLVIHTKIVFNKSQLKWSTLHLFSDKVYMEKSVYLVRLLQSKPHDKTSKVRPVIRKRIILKPC